VRLGANPSEADLEVLLQDMFVRAFSRSAREGYDGVRPFGAYLATIARNVVIDRARAARKHVAVVPLRDGEGIDAIEDTACDNPLWHIEEGELLAQVALAVASLPPREREVYALRYRQGLQQREVAERLGLALITVRRLDVQLRHHILESLRSAGHLREVAVGIPQLARDRSSG
jgi:RNA polymerase sigma-70 factor (ECF subfamily)